MATGTYDTEAAGAQDGHRTAADVWDDTSISLQPGTGVSGWVGLQFDLNKVTSDQPFITGASLTLRALLGFPSGVVSIYAVPELAPAPYSASLLPGNRDEILLDVGALSVGTSTDIIPIAYLPEDTTDGAYLGLSAMTHLLRNSGWSGILSLSVRLDLGNGVLWRSAENNNPGAPLLTTTETSVEHTGILDGPAIGRRARSRLCPRTGLPVASDEMVRDGYIQNMMVSKAGWDPEDPPDRYVPSPMENVVDDET